MSDLGVFVGFVVTCAVFSFAAAYWLAKLRPAWATCRINLLAASPLPVIIWLLCGWIYLMAALASERDCGIDACSMAMMSSFFVAVGAVPDFLVGLAFAWFGQRIADQ